MGSICLWGTCLKKIADEAQVEAVVKIFRTQLPEVHITMFSRDAEELMAQHPGVAAIDTRNLPRIARALSRADLLVFIGAPFFEEATQALACAVLLSMARFYRVPAIAYGASLFPFKTWWGRPWFRALLRSLEAVGVRERVAAGVLEDLGHGGEVSLFADPRFVLEPASPHHVRRILEAEGIDVRRPLVLVTTRRFDDDTPTWVWRTSLGPATGSVEATQSALAGAIDAVGGDADVAFLPMQPDYENDVRDARAVQERLRSPVKPRILSRRFSVSETLGLVAQAQLLLACRLGSAVFASVTGTPLVAVAHEQRMLDHMDRMGQGDCVFDWSTLEPDAYVQRVRRVWRGREAERATAQARTAEMVELAWRNADVIRAFLA